MRIITLTVHVNSEQIPRDIEKVYLFSGFTATYYNTHCVMRTLVTGIKDIPQCAYSTIRSVNGTQLSYILSII